MKRRSRAAGLQPVGVGAELSDCGRRDLSPRAWGAALDAHEQRSVRAHIYLALGVSAPRSAGTVSRHEPQLRSASLELPAVAAAEVLTMNPCTRGTEGPAADRGSALRIP